MWKASKLICGKCHCGCIDVSARSLSTSLPERRRCTISKLLLYKMKEYCLGDNGAVCRVVSDWWSFYCIYVTHCVAAIRARHHRSLLSLCSQCAQLRQRKQRLLSWLWFLLKSCPPLRCVLITWYSFIFSCSAVVRCVFVKSRFSESSVGGVDLKSVLFGN